MSKEDRESRRRARKIKKEQKECYTFKGKKVCKPKQYKKKSGKAVLTKKYKSTPKIKVKSSNKVDKSKPSSKVKSNLGKAYDLPKIPWTSFRQDPNY
jgi:hypothetical protein